MLRAESFPIGQRALLRRIDYRPTTEVTSDEYPFLLTTGRTLYQFNAGTMTGRTKNEVLRPADYLEISPADAARLKLTDGESVRLKSRYSEVLLPIRLNQAIAPGELYATFHTIEAYLNNVTSPHRDKFVGAPEYKIVAVALEKIGPGL